MTQPLTQSLPLLLTHTHTHTHTQIDVDAHIALQDAGPTKRAPPSRALFPWKQCFLNGGPLGWSALVQPSQYCCSGLGMRHILTMSANNVLAKLSWPHDAQGHPLDIWKTISVAHSLIGSCDFASALHPFFEKERCFYTNVSALVHISLTLWTLNYVRL